MTSRRPVTFEHLNDVLSHASSHSVLLIERAVVGLIRICSEFARKVSYPHRNSVVTDDSEAFHERSTIPFA